MRSITRHYPVMKLDAIKALPVAELAAPNCVLFMWTTDTSLPQALEVITSWGFCFKTVGFQWAKTNPKAKTFFTGCGWWTRGNVELCLLATKGNPKRVAKDVKRLVVADRREHSRKPDLVYTEIQRLTNGPYLELFARTQRDGWDTAFSNEPDRYPL